MSAIFKLRWVSFHGRHFGNVPALSAGQFDINSKQTYPQGKIAKKQAIFRLYLFHNRNAKSLILFKIEKCVLGFNPKSALFYNSVQFLWYKAHGQTAVLITHWPKHSKNGTEQPS
ncbi:hypothetical protein [Acetobacter cerevisiae]|uniref:hypothetical protein n=1 Tax=Acetobacter cerevisiae TaxID=178900 RepID=UPI0012E87B21|nr:hypothetical protein [Acetobacter cerevisiae]